jgi:hypothetical protein
MRLGPVCSSMANVQPWTICRAAAATSGGSSRSAC